jgi:predicted choloylglycine hydrolase
MRTAWHGRAVMAMSDCLWGALDGVNDAGLCIALAFGGRKVVGDGFGIPLVLRYILEFSDSTRDAVRVLKRIPVHMAYNVTVVDARGRFATVRLAPDREPEVTDRRAAANHQGAIEWPEHAAITRSAERAAALDACLAPRHAARAQSLPDFVSRFLHPPIYSSAFDRGWGTLYTAAYDPKARSASFLWPTQRMDQSLEAFTETELAVAYA